MDRKFAALVETLVPKLDQLLAMSPLTDGALPRNMPECGVYLFTEDGKHLYVGRSNDLRGRYGRHCRPGATDRQATFAFQLAREATGRVIRSYKQDENSRAALITLPEFRDAFTEAKARIRRMDYRFVEETDQNCQALLEIYCSIVLGTPYNDFKTH
jgi:hypothetical protein